MKTDVFSSAKLFVVFLVTLMLLCGVTAPVNAATADINYTNLVYQGTYIEVSYNFSATWSTGSCIASDEIGWYSLITHSLKDGLYSNGSGTSPFYDPASSGYGSFHAYHFTNGEYGWDVIVFNTSTFQIVAEDGPIYQAPPTS